MGPGKKIKNCFLWPAPLYCKNYFPCFIYFNFFVIFLYTKTLIRRPAVIKRMAVAFVPTGFLGFILYKIIKKFLLGNEQVVLWSLLIGGIFLIVFEILHKEKSESNFEIENISYSKAFWIGVFQSLAMIPGVSRSGATIVGGLLLGLTRKTIVEFSFLLAIPTMAAATGYDLMKNAELLSFENIGVIAVAFVVSFVVALAAIRWLLSYVRTHTFIPFGVYRILAALVFWLVILI